MIALFSEPIQIEFTENFPDGPWLPGMMLGCEYLEAIEYAFVVKADGTLGWVRVEYVRTFFRWDEEVQDWVDTSPDVRDATLGDS